MADVRVNLAFTADTSKAQSAIQSLQQSLSQLSGAGLKNGMSKEMEQASAAAKELQYHLNQAFNVKTGNFDLSRLDKSLKTSGQNIDVLSSKLLGAGQQGQQAFVQLAQSIAAAERPTITLSSRMTDLFTTLKNTAKWQISSSMLHGFIGAVQQAYGYAQDLNESLNNIRIVTGYDVDKMAQFAGEANKAAKALSTTTTAYTDASLIYYQQGLNDKEVKDRTDVTIKLANVARESAVTVSDQMTAVWNNFNDGSKSLEYYADVITKLGAATAASNSEIAEGIEKFSAISHTVGLSYEYATSALTTVVDRTRQSADVVGTAFKTMFARIQGLKLGETLEDGTTLNQYSQALKAVGIDIKESNGELKDMDVILDEMGAKWKELNRDEQVALAQKVAGVRQYQQLVSLMENYDFFKENVNLARGSEGALQEQADIYAESWEAASKRVKASAESIYGDLLNDKFFITMNNGLSGLLDSIDAFIDGFGGIGPLIAGIGSILLGMFAHKLPTAINNVKASFNILFKGAANQARELANEMKAVSQSILSSEKANGLSEFNRAALQNTIDLTTAKDRLAAVSAKMTGQEKAIAQAELSVIEAQQSEILTLAEKVDKRKESIDALTQEFDVEQAVAQADLNLNERELELIEAKKEAQAIFLANRNSENRDSYQQAIANLEQYREHIEETTAAFSSYSEALYQAYVNVLRQNEGQVSGIQATIEAKDAFEQYIVSLENLEASIQTTGNAPGVIVKTGETLQALQEDLEQLIGNDLPNVDKAFEKAFQTTSPAALKKAIQDIIKELNSTQIPAEKLEKILVKLGQGNNIKNLKLEFKTLGKELEDLKNKQAQVNKLLGSFDPSHQITGLEKMTAAAAGLGSLAMSISSVKSAISALGNSDLSFGEKLTTVFMSVSMLAGSLRSTLSNLNTAFGGFISMASNMAISLAGVQNVMKTTEVQTMLMRAATMACNGADQEMIANSLAKVAVKKGLIAADEAEGFALQTLSTLKKLDANASKEEVAAALSEMMQSILSAGAKTGETASRMGHVAALYAEAAAAIAANTALSPLLALTLLFVATLIGVAAIVAGIVIAFKALSDAYNADAIAAKKAHAVAKELSEAYDDCKQHYQDMINTMSQYKEARNSLEQLTKGTKEYDEALQKANRSAAELLSNNPSSFTPDDYKFEDGQLIIDDKALERVQAEGAKQEAAMYSASQVANAEAAQADAKALKTSTSRSISKESASSTMYLSEQQVAGVIDKIANENLTTTMSTKELFAEQIGTDPNSAYTKALWENRDALERCAKASLEASNQYDLATQVAVEELLSHNEDVENSDRTEEIKGAAKDKYDKYYQEELDKLDKWGKEGISKANGANDEAKKVFAEYAEAADLKGATLTDTKGSDKNRRFVYLNEEGDEKEVSLEAMQKVVAASRANDKIDNLGTDLATAVEVLDNYMNEIASNKDATQGEQEASKLINAIETSLLNGNLDNVAGSDLDNIQGIIDNTEGGIESILGSIFGGEDGKLTDEVAQQYGYDSAQAWIDSFNEQLSNAQVNWEELLAGLPDSIKKMAGSEGASSETYSALNSTYNSADKVQAGNGEAVISNINSVVSSVDAGDQSAVLEAMANIDWSDWDAVDQAKEAITELGAATPEAMEKLTGMTDQMRELNGAARDLDDLDLSLDSDVDEEEYVALAEHLQNIAESSDELADSLKYNEKEAKKVSEAILRFDKAIEKVDKNYDDWMKTMKSGSLQDQAKMATELKDAYADMLDIDVRSLSDDFVMNADNLELMKQAANGSEEAYNQLQAAVQEDILAHCDIDKSAFDAAKSELDTALADLDFENIEIGADLNSDAALNAMTDLVNAAGMTAQQATDYLASMGVDAEVEEVKVPKPSTTETVDIVAKETPGTANIPIIAADGTVGSTKVPIPSIKYEGVKHETPAESEETVTSLKVTSAHKSSGGGFKHRNSNHGGGTGGSKSCFIAGTPVSLGKIFKNIEDIQIGDIVLSYNEQTHKNEYSEVLQTMIHIVNEDIYDLYIKDEVLSVTGIHKFLIKRNNYYDWIPASDLQIHDKVLFANGTWHEINEININLQFTTVYNFEVANNHNYYVGKNQILAHNKGGGGGGGGSSKPAEQKDYTKKSDVVDRYKQINDKLNTVNKNMDKYNKLSELAYGKNKLSAMNKILNAYKQQIQLQQQLKAEAEGYLPEDKKNMETAAADLGTRKLQYDKDGNVKNIEAVQSDIFEKIHAAEEKYNSFATKDQQDEYNKSTLEPLMKQYEEFKNYLSKYEETKQQIADAEAAELDAQMDYMNKKLEVVGKKRQVKMDFRETEIKMFSREIEKLENQAFAAGKRIAYLTASMKAMNDQVKIEKTSAKSSILNGVYFLDENGNPKKNKNGTLKTLGDSDKYKNLSLDQLLNKMQDPKFWETHGMNEKTAEQLMQALDNLMELDQSLDELKETIDHQIVDTFNRWAQVMERHMRQMEHYTSRANTWMEIVNEVGKTNLGWNSQQMQKYRQKNWDVNLNKTKADYSQHQTYYEEYQKAKSGYHTIVNNKKSEAADASEAAKAHDDKAATYEKKAANIRGSQMQKNLDTWRKRREEIKEELKDKKLTKEQKEKLKKEDSELKENINKVKNSDKYKESITYKKQQRDKVKEQITELEAKDKLTKKEEKQLENLKEKQKLLNAQIKNLRAQAEEYDNLAKAEKSQAEQERNNAKAIESEIESIKSDLYDMKDQVMQSRDQLYEDLLNLIQLSKENLSAYLDDVTKDFEAKVSGVYGSIENMQTAFEQNKQISERYLQDTEKIYELTKLNRDITKKMDETQNIKAKEKLKKLQEDITKYAEQGVKMSEYDLQIMQKQYDLEVAKIAMEEAQNAKTQVRLTRDAEGNYSYTYTADESKQAEAEQTYEDKLNDIIKYNNDYQLQMQEMILNTEKAEEDAINRLREQYENSEITLDQFYAQAEQAHAFYKSQMQYYAQENEKASENSVYFFATEYDAYYSNTDKKIKVNRTFSDDARQTYEQVHQIYKEAAINRDKALYDEEIAYKKLYNEKAAELKKSLEEGKITQEQADIELAKLAREHSANLDTINVKYTEALQREVTLQNGTKKSASDYFQGLVEGDSKKNSEAIQGMELANHGFIVNTETEFLPGLGTTYGKATDTVKKFADAVSDGNGDNNNKTLLGQMKKGMQDHEANVKSAEEAIGIILSKEEDAYDGLAKEANKNMNQMKKDSEDLAKEVDADGKKAIEDMDLTVKEVKKWYKENKKWLKKTKESIDNVTTAIKNMIAAANGIKPIKVTADTKEAEKNLKNLKKAYDDLAAAQKKTPTNPTIPTTPETPTTQTGLSNKEKLEIAKKVAASIWLLGDWKNEEGGGHDRKWKLTQVFGSSGQSYIQSKINSWTKSGEINQIASDYSKYASSFTWAKMKKYIDSDQYKFATGGYTGRWGADGRWALLHEKELVLNKEDTENMLAAIKTVREIAAIVDLQAQQAGLSGQYALALGHVQNTKNAQLDQNVHITAEFPNVQDHNEVELALTSLVNRASQYAWRN